MIGGLANNSTFGNGDGQYINSNFSILRLVLILIARGGFVLIQSGSIPTEQFYDLLLHNIVEFAISSASYGLIGSILAFGKDSLNGAFGYGNYSTLLTDFMIYGYCSVIFGCGIVTTCLASRLHFIAYALIAFVYSGVTQPLILHWIHHPNGWMKTMDMFNRTATLHDHSGGISMHLTSGLISFIGLCFLGRRLLKLYDIDEYSISSESPTIVVFGYFLSIVGFIGYSLPTGGFDNKLIGTIMINDILSISGGGIASIIIELFIWKVSFNFWVVLRVMQGGLIGFTIMSSIIDVCYPPVTFATALVAGSIICSFSKTLFKLAVEDYCNIISIYLIPGVWAPVIQSIACAVDPFTPTAAEIITNCLWYGACCFITGLFISTIYCTIFMILWCTGVLRNEFEKNCHLRSLNAMKFNQDCPVHRLFGQSQYDDFLEPGVSGKTPNEAVHVHQHRDILRNFRVRYPEYRYIMKNDSKPPSDPYLASGWSQKTIFTMQSRPILPESNDCNNHPFSSGDNPFPSGDNPFSSGDGSEVKDMYKLEEVIGDDGHTKVFKQVPSAQTNKQRSSIFKRKSYHRLSPSSKYIDFPTRKKVVRKSKNKNNAFILALTERDEDLKNFDAKYNDGFITIKLPSSRPSLSD